MVVGIVSFFFLPDRPYNNKKLTERQRQIAVTRLIRDDPHKAGNPKAIVPLKEVWDAVSDWNVWPNLVFAFLIQITTAGYGMVGCSKRRVSCVDETDTVIRLRSTCRSSFNPSASTRFSRICLRCRTSFSLSPLVFPAAISPTASKSNGKSFSSACSAFCSATC